MKISLAWLNAHLDRPVTGDEADALLTGVGFPLDGREPVAVATGSAGADDELLDVEVTSNRGDCLSHVGVAREVAAASGRRLISPNVTLPEASGDAASIAAVVNDAPDLCPLYTARVVRGVKVGPSPAWLRQRLQAISLRSVNNVVDVTNFVLHEMGQPLHAFDLGKLAGRKIVVRTARDGEPFTAIDGSRHKLPAGALVIADASVPVAVAGVMGGQDTEVSEATTDVLIESALFVPLSVRRTSRALKLASDSSYRFERGVDPLGVDAASRRAAKLIVEMAGGELCEGVIRAGQADPAPRRVTMRLSRCAQLLGRDVSPQRATDLLSALQLSPQQQGADELVCTVPTFRRDIEREIDLIEEIARLDGYDRIAVEPRLSLVVRPPQATVSAMRELRRVLVSHGYHETVTFSFVRPEHGKPFLTREGVMIDDARRKAEPMLRPSLLPSLLACRKTNQDAGNRNVRLFETAATYQREGDAIVESRRVAMLADAVSPGRDDVQQALRDLRGGIEELVEHLHGRAVTIEPGRAEGFAGAGLVHCNECIMGVLGAIDPAVVKAFDLQTPVVAAELDLDALIASYPPPRRVSELPRYPGIERDLSIVIDESAPWQRVATTVADVKPELLESVAFVGTYRGKPIEKGRKSVTLRMLFRDPQRTLRHEEVDPQVQRVVEALHRTLGATLRT
jgi:phenylalanyl-tRNA synthetase beta chain